MLESLFNKVGPFAEYCGIFKNSFFDRAPVVATSAEYLTHKDNKNYIANLIFATEVTQHSLFLRLIS